MLTHTQVFFFDKIIFIVITTLEFSPRHVAGLCSGKNFSGRFFNGCSKLDKIILLLKNLSYSEKIIIGKLLIFIACVWQRTACHRQKTLKYYFVNMDSFERQIIESIYTFKKKTVKDQTLRVFLRLLVPILPIVFRLEAWKRRLIYCLTRKSKTVKQNEVWINYLFQLIHQTESQFIDRILQLIVMMLPSIHHWKPQKQKT